MNLSVGKSWKVVTKDSYDNHAEEFASFASICRGKMRKWIEYFSSQFAKNALILDMGCGAGRDALYFANKGLSVTGIDFSERLIEIAKKKVKSGKFLVMDFENLSFPENSFDGIWANASIYHIPRENLPDVYKNIYLVLKKGGLFFSTYRVGQGEMFTKEKRGEAILERFAAYYNSAEIKNLLNKTGFKNIEFESDLIETGPWVRFLARK